MQRPTQDFPDMLGIELYTVEAELVEAALAIRPELRAPRGYLHAGVVVALADTACGHGVLAGLPVAAAGFTTVELKSNFLATATAGVLVCSARRRHGGRTIQTWDATVSCRRRTLALFRCTQLLLRSASESETP